MKLYLLAAGAALCLVACGGNPQGPMPAAAPAHVTSAVVHASRTPGHLILLGGIKPDAKCPTGYVYCVTVSRSNSATVYFCFSTGSYCGPSQPQYGWESDFVTRKNHHVITDFQGSFNPNPGDPTYDTISEIHAVKSTHGKYKYFQNICVYYSSSTCDSYFYVGIAVQ